MFIVNREEIKREFYPNSSIKPEIDTIRIFIYLIGVLTTV